MNELMGYPILRSTVVVKIPSEGQAIAMIEELKQKQSEEGYTVTKSGYVLKVKKAKGEIIDSWYVVTCQKDYEEE